MPWLRLQGMTHGQPVQPVRLERTFCRRGAGSYVRASAANYGEVETLSAYVERYLSPRHRDAPGAGCAIATLGCEVPRQGNAMRQAFTAGVRRLIERLTRLLGPKSRRKREDEALAIASTMVGGMILAR